MMEKKRERDKRRESTSPGDAKRDCRGEEKFFMQIKTPEARRGGKRLPSPLVPGVARSLCATPDQKQDDPRPRHSTSWNFYFSYLCF